MSQNPGDKSNKSDASQTPVSLRSSTLQSLVRPGLLRKAPGAASTPKTGGFVPSLTSATNVTPKPKAKAPMKFIPNVNRTVAPIKPTAATQKTSTNSQNVSLQTMLAHRLAVQSDDNLQAPITRRMNTGGTRIINTAISNKLAAYDEMRRKKDGKKSRDILELSWAPEGHKHDISLYTPISLPYVVRAGEEDEHGKTRTQRPSMKKVDEGNRNAAHLFEEDEDEEAFNWTLVQFPSLLPAMDRTAMEKQAEDAINALKDPEEVEAERQAAQSQRMPPKKDDIDLKYVPTTLTGLPEGQLGEITVHKSGRVVLHIGSHEFDVNTGSDCNFNQEVGCYVPSNQEFFFMGNCFKRMVITPAVQSMADLSSR